MGELTVFSVRSIETQAAFITLSVSGEASCPRLLSGSLTRALRLL